MLQLNKAIYKRLYSIDITSYPPELVRNFCIIAHVDHGKSTLSDRLLEQTGLIQSKQAHQYLDKLQVEKQRGITVKAQAVTMPFKFKSKSYLINLIDTPGHVDFSYEVSRSLAACQGCCLVVDASQGIKAQTLANFYLAFSQGLTIIPVINKIDLPFANVPKVKQQLKEQMEFEPDSCLLVSAKTGLNVDQILPRIVNDVPPPGGKVDGDFKALMFDSWFDDYKGVICMVSVVDGVLRKGDHIACTGSPNTFTVLEVGILCPEMSPTDILQAGQVGYIVSGMKTTREAKIGDTFFHASKKVNAISPLNQVKPMVFAGFFPGDDKETLSKAMSKLLLNDPSVSCHLEVSDCLGQGYRCGFLGTLHMEVFKQRLEQEYNANIIVTVPTVPYNVVFTNGKSATIKTPSEYPEINTVERFEEPFVTATIVVPLDKLGQVISLCTEKRGIQTEMTFVENERVTLCYELPLQEVATNFHDNLKRITSGYASFDYQECGYRETVIKKLVILLNSKKVDVFSFLVHESKLNEFARDIVTTLKSKLQRQEFPIAIQAVDGTRIVARETLSSAKKNVTEKCYGGDETRKKKLLERHKEKIDRLKMVANVPIPHSLFMTIVTNNK